jgi:hypothetical protein
VDRLQDAMSYAIADTLSAHDRIPRVTMCLLEGM